MFKRQAEGSIFNSVNFFGRFVHLRIFLLPKHPFIRRSNFLQRLPRFIPVFRKIHLIDSKW